MTDIAALKAANAKRWDGAKLTRGPEFKPVAARLVAPGAKARYVEISKATGVPWFVVAVIHERESSQNWNAQLAQGDPLGRVSTHVPVGHGPFLNHPNDPPLQDAFYRGALDALIDCPPYAARNTDWSIGGLLTKLEEYNGLGYAARQQPSPYIWSGTDQYKSGKYVRDGVYDPNAVDRQLGCAGLLVAMMALDPSIRFDKNPSSVTPPATDPLPAEPSSASIANPSKGSIGAFVASLIAVIFKRK